MQRQSNPVAFVAGVASQQVLAPNPNRQVLILSAPSGARVSYAFGQPATLDGGITLQAGSMQLELTREHYGDVLTQALNVIASAAATNVGVFEVLGP